MSHSFLRCKQNKCVNYPTTRRNSNDWWVVYKIKARTLIEVSKSNVIVPQSSVLAFQENLMEFHPINLVADDGPQTLTIEDGNSVDIDETHVEEDSEEDLIVESDEDNEKLSGDDFFDSSDE